LLAALRWKNPVRPNEVALVRTGMAIEVILMLGLSLPKRASGNYLCHDGAGPETASVDRGDRVRRDAHLETCGKKHRRSITRTDVVALAVPSGWVMDLEKELEEMSVARFFCTEQHLYGLSMGSNVLICGRGFLPADISNTRSDDAWVTAQ
jgi:hypothetical protein